MICHDYKCIFVHIPKNAGQSIERVFVELVGLQWPTRAPLLLRANREPALGPPKLAHLKANEYVLYKYLTEEMFDEYFKFSFTRNPWSRMVSIYKHFGYDRSRDFKTFMKNEFKNKIYHQWKWFVGPQSQFLCDKNGDILVNYVGKVESLQNHFNHICHQLNIPETKVPHTNSSNQRAAKFQNNSLTEKFKMTARNLFPDILTRNIEKHKNYQDYYDQECIDLVFEIYSRDVELFNYDFE